MGKMSEKMLEDEYERKSQAVMECVKQNIGSSVFVDMMYNYLELIEINEIRHRVNLPVLGEDDD